MRTKLKYGDHTHDLADAAIVINRTNTFSENNKRTGYIETWTIDGFLQADTQDAIGTKINTLKDAYDKDNETAVLLFEDGSETNHKLDTADSVSGVRVRLVDFPEGRGAEYSTFRSYRIVIDAEFADDAGIIQLVETLTFTGGGSKFLHKQTLIGLPQKQFVAQNIPFRVTQAGFSVGHLFWPNPLPPIFPNDLKNEESSTVKTGPENVYAKTHKATHFRTSWNYAFESVGAMNANPTF
ncbi:MAG: hypothetical protein IID46_11510 [Planctomycetes bacterium]|nr:hypothetical protein [Planctomycetota bacterium]